MSHRRPIHNGCWNCGDQNHGFRQCRNPPRPHCHLCGNPDVPDKYHCPRETCRQILREEGARFTGNDQFSPISATTESQGRPVTQASEAINATSTPGKANHQLLTPASATHKTPLPSHQVESELRSALEAFLATHICDLVPTRPVTITIPEIKIEIGPDVSLPPARECAGAIEDLLGLEWPGTSSVDGSQTVEEDKDQPMDEEQLLKSDDEQT